MKVLFAPHYAKNPYQDRLKEQLENLGYSIRYGVIGTKAFFNDINFKEADVIHIHWLHSYILKGTFSKATFRVIYFLTMLFFAKRKNKKIVWTVHNLYSHDRKYVHLEEIFLRFFVRLVDRFSVHNKFTKEQLLDKYKLAPQHIQVIHHANYINSYPTFQGDKDEIKRFFNLDVKKKTFMFLGNIKPYKGLDMLINSFVGLDATKNQLLICGKVSNSEDLRFLMQATDSNSNIFVYPNFIEEEKLSGILAIADVLVYPYRDITTSGALLLGMSYRKMCVCSNVGSMGELVQHEYLFNDKQDLSNILEKISIMSNEEIELVGQQNFQHIKRYTWAEMARRTDLLYKSIDNGM